MMPILFPQISQEGTDRFESAILFGPSKVGQHEIKGCAPKRAGDHFPKFSQPA
jgi:hypothetical protein